MSYDFSLSIGGIVGLLLALALGLLEMYVYMRAVRPVLVNRYENKKVTQEQGRNPLFIQNLLLVQSYIVLPVIGYMLGNSIFNSVGAN